MSDQNFLQQINDQLNEDQLQKLLQFKDISGKNDFESYHILHANDWNFEIALDLTLDGAYNNSEIIQNIIEQKRQQQQQQKASNSSFTDSTELRRRRNIQTQSADNNDDNNDSNISSSSSTSMINDNRSAINNENSDSNNSSNDNENNENNSLHMIVRNVTTWILKLPFILIMKTYYTFYDFIMSMIYPTLHYDPNGTVERFINEYEDKYGQQHPEFFRGTFSQVIDHGKREIRFVLIFIYTSSYRDIDKYCTTVINSQKLINLINEENIVFWSCTLDYPDGYKAYQSLKTNQYPSMALFGLKNNKMVIMKRIEGFHTVDNVVAMLRTAIQNNEFSLMAARLDRQERDMASLIRAQQDAAFEESLKADQEKERRKREEREQNEQKERLEKLQQQAEQERKQRISNLKSTLLSEISLEPDINDSNAWRIMFKLPNGTRLERRFNRNDPVKYLYYYVFCKGENELINFKLRTNFPTRDLPGHSPSYDNDDDVDNNSDDMNLPLEQCNIDNNIVLFVHDLDS